MALIPEPSPWLPGFEPAPAAAFAPPMPPVPPDPLLDDEPDDDEHDPVRSPPPWRPSEPPAPATQWSAWPRLPLAGLGIPSGAVAKFEANLAAIDTLRLLEATDAEPHDDMRGKLLRYTGWGGLPASFNLEAPEPAWARRAAQLRDTLDDDYLSGEVKTKLRQALAAGSDFARNVTALERVQPEDLPPASIEARLGAVWIPAGDIEDFIRQVLEQKDCEVGYSAQAGAWSVRYPVRILDHFVVAGDQATSFAERGLI